MSAKRFPILPAALFGVALLGIHVPARAAGGEPGLEEGRKVFSANCAACHGKRGEGDGPVGRVLATPPYNLTWSVAGDDYLRQIIPKGGEAMERSPDMPAWGGVLSPAEIESVILYIKTLRVPQ